MRIHHLNCGTLCPRGARLINGKGGLFEPGRSICHCLLIEADNGLVLLDTGFGAEDVRNPKQLGPVFALMNPQTTIEETALEQVKDLGFDPADVRQIVTTHLDPDHSGGLPDFPQAEVHIFGRELDAALHPSLRDRPRYLGVHWKHSPRWVRHDAEGDDWFGFEGVKILPDLGTEVLMVPLIGHTLGHTGIAIKRDDDWLLHCGDAYFHHNEIATPPSCPPGLRFFQNLNNADRRQRRANQERLRELASRHGDEVQMVCSHDPDELDLAQAGSADATPA
jgi:glyoxylase-like metal-dependent hydrolase (beta-lactamase superfamily II)